ncbi:hypothetical protein AB5J72_17920 [Streptomyces sp. CG1]|uniref:hypothetical protein n=1 Tax=Streptomyces sp. CG1 TaxID=1287523 RepID=UPI0034E29CE4
MAYSRATTVSWPVAAVGQREQLQEFYGALGTGAAVRVSRPASMFMRVYLPLRPELQALRRPR